MTDRPPRDLDETRPQRLTRAEERIVPHVREEEAGRVRVDKRVVEEREEIEVTLRHDELDLERRRADRPLKPGEQPVVTHGDTTILLVVEERLEVRKVPWVVEEIHLRRRLKTEQRRIADTVRKERFEIKTEGEIDLKQTT